MYFTFAKNTQAILRMFKFIPDEFVLTFLRLLEKGMDAISEAYILATKSLLLLFLRLTLSR
jgi:hypothetical protein